MHTGKHTDAHPLTHTQIKEVCLFVLSLRRWSMEQKFTWRHQGESHYLDQWPWPCSFSLWTQTHIHTQKHREPHSSVCIGNLLRLKQYPKYIFQKNPELQTFKYCKCGRWHTTICISSLCASTNTDNRWLPASILSKQQQQLFLPATHTHLTLMHYMLNNTAPTQR